MKSREVIQWFGGVVFNPGPKDPLSCMFYMFPCSNTPDSNDRIMWMRCVGAGKRLKHPGRRAPHAGQEALHTGWRVLAVSGAERSRKLSLWDRKRRRVQQMKWISAVMWHLLSASMVTVEKVKGEKNGLGVINSRSSQSLAVKAKGE